MSGARSGSALYTPETLALAVALAEHPLDDGLPLLADARSRVCGSKVTIAVRTDDAGRIAEAGARVTACAIGQAAAALFLDSAPGRSREELANTLASLEEWLGGAADPPAWPHIEALASARAYPARHAAILLPWKAALAALSNPPGAD